MKIKRRDFLKKSALSGGLAGFGIHELLGTSVQDIELYQSRNIEVSKPEKRAYFEPLEFVKVKTTVDQHAKKIKVTDAQGNSYHEQLSDAVFSFRAGGALGYHLVSVYDKNDVLLDWAAFPVDCETEIVDEGGVYTDFMNILYQTLTTSYASLGRPVRYNHKHYTTYSSWFQDHVFVAEGMKYFMKDIKSGVDLYADGQREDGLIWDNYKHAYPEVQSFWEYRFDYGGFTYRPEDTESTAIFVRIPVENIGEHTFIEGLYYAWKATGDTEWMKTRLKNALKAVEFATSSPYYWSEEKQLLKRPFSIDRWDFQSDFDAEISSTDFMGANLEKTRYGIMFGDNICMANGCGLLSEMCQSVGWEEEAQKMSELGKSLWQRINDLSWKGNFYRHWFPLDPDREPDFGVDTSAQITLSNAMALIRGLEHEKCVEIIKTYQDIRKVMPDSSPGEWYLCYPPFEKGWHINKWEYMNGGISPILAGDLALGAFEHGYEDYAVDILKRLHELAKESGYEMKGAYKGKMPDEPVRNFKPLDISKLANTGFSAGNENTNGWVGGEEADFRNLPTGIQKWEGITFEVINPAKNNQKGCIAVSKEKDNQGNVTLPVNQKAGSLYLLHTMDGKGVAGTFYIWYEDGSFYSRYINESVEIGHYWYPKIKISQKGIPNTKIAWRGSGKEVKDVGIYAFGMDNPYPEKKIERFQFINPQSSNWVIFGVTLSDGPHYFKPPVASTIPDHWAAAHVMKALIEGLAGIKNAGLAFDKAILSPRWDMAGVDKVKATAKYEASGGYLSYSYQKLNGNTYEFEFTSNSKETEIRFLLPDGAKINSLSVNGEVMSYNTIIIEESTYISFRTDGVGVYRVRLKI